MKNLFKIWRQTHKSMPFATHVTWTIKSAMLAGYFVLELVLAALSPSRTDEINIFNMWLQLSAILLCFADLFCLFCFKNYGTEAVVWLFLECFKMNKKWEWRWNCGTAWREARWERQARSWEKGNSLNYCMLRKFRVEWKQLYPWLDYKDGKMFCLWCCEYGNLSNASSSFVTGGCTNLKINMLQFHDISTAPPKNSGKLFNHYFSLIVFRLIIWVAPAPGQYKLHFVQWKSECTGQWTSTPKS